jgi:hypothetical protein
VSDQSPTPGGANAGQGQAKPACAAHSKDGQPCRAFALPGGTLCHWHEPARAERQREASIKGGRMTALRSRRLRLNTAAALIRFNGGLLQDVLEGITQADLARAVFYGLSVQAKLVELHQTSDFEHRLAVLEERLPTMPKGRAVPWVG